MQLCAKTVKVQSLNSDSEILVNQLASTILPFGMTFHIILCFKLLLGKKTFFLTFQKV
jgi:hypothetical protein